MRPLGFCLIGCSALCLICGFAFASVTPTTIWQIGLFDEGGEFQEGSGFYDIFDYNVDENPDDEINGPSMARHLYTTAKGPYPTARVININFNLTSPYENAIFEYSRHGTEINAISLDSLFVANTSGSVTYPPQLFVIPLETLAVGDHTITLTYEGGGDTNGNYIDALRLSGIEVPEPCSLVLLGLGCLALRKLNHGNQSSK
jgi:hypothetical protein